MLVSLLRFRSRLSEAVNLAEFSTFDIPCIDLDVVVDDEEVPEPDDGNLLDDEEQLEVDDILGRL